MIVIDDNAPFKLRVITSLTYEQTKLRRKIQVFECPWRNDDLEETGISGAILSMGRTGCSARTIALVC